MKARLLSLVLVSAVWSAPAFADCATDKTKLSQTQISTVLGGHYACGRSSADPPGWNELHNGASGGTLQEQHEGGTTVENVGSWSTSVVSGNSTNGIGQVSYAYSGGDAPGYTVAVAGSTTNCNNNATCTNLPQTYYFCGVAGGAPASLQIRVSASVLALSGCPSN